jgi:hypothetical protein
MMRTVVGLLAAALAVPAAAQSTCAEDLDGGGMVTVSSVEISLSAHLHRSVRAAAGHGSGSSVSDRRGECFDCIAGGGGV